MLWTLGKLSGVYHQRILSIQLQDPGAFMKDAFVAATGPLKIYINRWIPDRNEFEIASLPANASITLKDKAAFPIEIIFSQSGEAVAGRPILPALRRFIGITESIVLGLEAEACRLKSING